MLNFLFCRKLLGSSNVTYSKGYKACLCASNSLLRLLCKISTQDESLWFIQFWWFCQRMRERNPCVCVHVPMIQVSSHSPHTKLNINTNSKSTMLCNATQGNGMLKLIAHYFEIEAAFVLLIKTISNSFSLIMVILVSFCTFRFVFIVPFASLSHIIKVKIHCIWTSAENHSKFYLCAMLLNIFKAIFEFVRSQITQMKAKTARSVSTM